MIFNYLVCLHLNGIKSAGYLSHPVILVLLLNNWMTPVSDTYTFISEASKFGVGKLLSPSPLKVA